MTLMSVAWQTAQMQHYNQGVGTEGFWSPLWQEGQQYKAVDDLASLVLSFAWLLNMRTESSIERIRWVAKLQMRAWSRLLLIS